MSNVEEVKLNVAASVDQTQRALQTLRGVADSFDEALTRLPLLWATRAIGPGTRTALAHCAAPRPDAGFGRMSRRGSRCGCPAVDGETLVAHLALVNRLVTCTDADTCR
jgi:hypothetical protein